MLAWSYWQTIFTSVGTVPKQFKVSATDLERLEQAENQEAQKQIFEQLVKDLPTMTRTPLGGWNTNYHRFKVKTNIHVYLCWSSIL